MSGTPVRAEMTLRVWTDDGDVTTLKVPNVDLQALGAALTMRTRNVEPELVVVSKSKVQPPAPQDILFAMTGRLVPSKDGTLFSQTVDRALPDVDESGGPEGP